MFTSQFREVLVKYTEVLLQLVPQREDLLVGILTFCKGEFTVKRQNFSVFFIKCSQTYDQKLFH